MADQVQGGRFARMARLAGVAARTTRDVLAARAMQKISGSSELDVGEALRPSAERLVEVLGEMKGAATKLGQFISLVDQDTFPEEARKALTKLLNQAPQRMTHAQARNAVMRELGAPIEQWFSEFDLDPLAAASVGQVHAATTKDGRDVVVKLQFPGVDKAIEADLRNVGVLSRTLALAGGVLDTQKYYEEIATTLRRELDYRQEIVQANAYREAIAPWPQLVVPQAVPELSSERMLTMERLRGPTMLEFAQDETRQNEERFRVSRQLIQATWGPFLRERLIHADPHPGNYIVMADGRLGVLDFGATKRLSAPFALAYWHILGAAFAGERADLYSLLVSANFQMHGDRAKIEVWLNELGDIVERPFRVDEYDWGGCRISSDVRKHAQDHPVLALAVRAPEESLMFYRSAAGVAGDLRMLRARGDFRATMMQTAEIARQNISSELADLLPPAPHADQLAILLEPA